MRFLKIQIKNLFSYRDAIFEFPDQIDPAKNVVLIHGRNGFGKTSFINALKLFFVGNTNEDIRAVRRGRNYNPREYMLGAGAEWEGAINRRAISVEKETGGSISVTWSEPLGIVTGTRSWRIDGPYSVTETLEISPNFQIDEGLLDEYDQRQEFLERRLPSALVPFFIYDAEQVQRIAESNSEAMLEQIERLFDITAINTAEEYVYKTLQKLRKESNAQQEQFALEVLRKQYEMACSLKKQIDAEIDSIEIEERENKRRIAELDRRMRNSKAAQNEQSEGILKTQLSTQKSALEEKTGQFLDTFPEVAPLICHPQIIEQAMAKLKLVSQGRVQLADELGEILSRLPTRLFDEPKHHPTLTLDDGLKQFLKKKLATLIDAEIVLARSPVDEGQWGLSIDRARRVEEQINLFSNSVLRESFIGQLRDISKLNRDELNLKTELEDLSTLPKREREKQEERKTERDALNAASEALREKIGGLRERSLPISRNIEKLRGEVNFQERKVSEATRNQINVQIAEKTLNGIRIYKGAFKQAKQKEVQEAMNRNFKILMDSHSLVQKIAFDEDFNMTYLDESGSSVGMASISAGMKQIAAQALLWALKDVADTPCPVVIDTPLARIDAGHQKLLITRFFPAAAEQVIVLPTDSELDATKYAMLKPYICAEFCLNNPTGDSTMVSSGVPMYPSEVQA